MTDGEKKREYLDNWSGLDKVEKINNDYPNCGCESAAATQNGHGSIENCEILRYLACTTSDIKQKTVSNFRITPAIFSRIFTKGVSIIRMDYATFDELNLTAKIQYDIHSHSDKSGDNGGVVGVVDFTAKDIRFPKGNDKQVCCIFDTPANNRISHADIICSLNNLSDIKKNRIMMDLFKKIGGESAFTVYTCVVDFKIDDYIPNRYRK